MSTSFFSAFLLLLVFVNKGNPPKTILFLLPKRESKYFSSHILTFKIIWPLLRLKVAPLLLQCCSEHWCALWVAPAVLLGAVGVGGGGP